MVKVRSSGQSIEPMRQPETANTPTDQPSSWPTTPIRQLGNLPTQPMGFSTGPAPKAMQQGRLNHMVDQPAHPHGREVSGECSEEDQQHILHVPVSLGRPMAEVLNFGRGFDLRCLQLNVAIPDASP